MISVTVQDYERQQANPFKPASPDAFDEKTFQFTDYNKITSTISVNPIKKDYGSMPGERILETPEYLPGYIDIKISADPRLEQIGEAIQNATGAPTNVTRSKSFRNNTASISIRPTDGVVTHDMVKQTLEVLRDMDAINSTDCEAAKKAYGLPHAMPSVALQEAAGSQPLPKVIKLN